jgi:hypothetical protein
MESRRIIALLVVMIIDGKGESLTAGDYRVFYVAASFIAGC